YIMIVANIIIFFFQAEDGIRDRNVTGVQTCALPIYLLIKIKLNACINIEIKINKSPVEIDAKPSSPTIEVTIIPINPKKKPNNRNLVILSFSNITDKIIVTRGAAPKIIPALTPVVLAKPNAKKE